MSTLSIRGTQQLINGTSITRGQVGHEDTARVQSHRIRPDGTLEIERDEHDVVVEVSDFLYVEDEVLITVSTDAEVPRRMVETATGATIESGRINIEKFAETHAEANPFLAWGRDAEGDLKSVCGVGNIAEDEDFSQRLEASENTQLSFEGLLWNGRELRGTVTRSGYVEIYSPRDVGSEEFTRFLLEEVIQHASPN